VSLAGVTLSAKPGKLGGQNLFSHSQENHADYLSRIIFGVNVCHRATCGTKPTGETKFDVFSPGLFSYIILEFSVLLI
jgi:hypothetical protein